MAVARDFEGRQSRWRDLLADLSAPTALQHGAIGILCGIVTTIFAMSYAALLFSGSLAEHVAAGVGMMAFACAVFAIVSAFLASYRPIYAQVREIPIAYLALVAPAVAAQVGGENGVLPTLVAMVAGTAFVLGLCFFAVGQLGLSRFIRFIPFPVMSGFLAGVAWLIIAGALAILAGEPVGISSLGLLGGAETWPKLACAAAFMVAVFAATRFFRRGLAIPVLVLLAVGLFHLVVSVAGISDGELAASGWLVALPAGGGLWPPVDPSDLSRVDWQAILTQAPTIAVIIPVAMMAVLLNISGLEVDAKRDIDLDKEMKTAGVGNVLAALGGGAPGYQSLSMTLLSRDLGGGTRLTTLVAGLVLLLVLVLGRPLIQLVPLPVFAGVILATGAGLLYERLVRSYRRLSLPEYLILLGIFVLTVWLGFLVAVAFGTVAAMALFVFDYSRSSVVKLELTGRDYQSSAMTSDARRQLLQQHGDAILIMRLQGFLFFGTANGLRRAIERRIAARRDRPVRFLVLDFRLVYGMDSAAVQSFIRLADNARRNGVSIVLAHAADDVVRTLSRAGLSVDGRDNIRLTSDLDTGLAECEQEVLAEVSPDLAEARPLPIGDQLAAFTGDEATAGTLASHMRRIEFVHGDTIIAQGSPSDELYFIESGVASICVATDTGQIRLATMGPGGIVGEISFYLGKPRTASVFAEGPVAAWRFNRGDLARIAAAAPDTAARFHGAMAAMLADRLTATNRLVRFLAE